jgi:hypothetical protein
MSTNTKYTVIKTISWGGSDDSETLLDVLAEIQIMAPSAKFTIIEAYPSSTGGWPLFGIEFNESDYDFMDDFFCLS